MTFDVTPIEENAVYTTKEIINILKISSRTLGKFNKSGELKPIQIGRKNRYMGSEVLRFLRAMEAKNGK